MQIYLTRPGGEREGPYTVEEINRDLAAKRYADTDYWAWFSGQTEWIPLHKVPGVVGSDSTTAWTLDQPPQDASRNSVQEQPSEVKASPAEASPVTAPAGAGAERTSALEDQGSAAAEPSAPASRAPVATPPKPDETSLESKLFSGLPVAALEQVFILTTGDGRTAARSAVTIRMLEQTVGESHSKIREIASRDVVSNCAFIEQLRTQAALPSAAWSTMANFKMQLVQDARAGLFKVCVRSFPIESGDLVCLFLFYNRAKL
jgi:hypothetical protein